MTDGSSGFVIAVVDDDRSILRSLEYLLESADYSVRVFDSAAKLLDSGCLAHIHCLISDIGMPGIEGFELLQRVHAACPALPVILITGYPDTLRRLPSFEGPAPRTFTKPFPGPDLLAAIADALEARRA